MLTLVLTQLLGVMHGTVHGQEMHAPENHAPGAPHEHGYRQARHHDLADHGRVGRPDGHHGHEAHEATAEHGEGWVEAIFASHEADSDCRLFDQASHGSAAPALAAVTLPVMLPSVVVGIPQGEALARWAALFDARAPPASQAPSASV